jgi:hypothetical protein
LGYRIVNPWTNNSAVEARASLSRRVDSLRAQGLDGSFYEPIIRGDPPQRGPFEGTMGEIEVHEILGRIFRELGRRRYPDFVTGGPSFEVVTITESEVQSRALRYGYTVANELLKSRGEFTTAIYSKSMTNPLLRYDAKPLKGGNLIAGGELLIDNSPWQNELSEAIYKRVKKKGHKNRVNETHSSVVVNLSRLTCAHPLMLKNLLEGMFKPHDFSIDSVLLASLGQGNSMRLVYVGNCYASSPLDRREIEKAELTELVGHPFLFFLPTLVRHGEGAFDFLRSDGNKYTIGGTEVSNSILLGGTLTALTGIAMETPHNLTALRIESGKERHAIHFI